MATEKRFVEANALIAEFDEQNSDTFIQYHTRENKEYWWGMNAGINWGVNTINNAPTVDAVEVVHGRWIPIIDEPTPLRKRAMLSGYRCSVCGRYEKEEQPYCNCGAKMDGDGNG